MPLPVHPKQQGASRRIDASTQQPYLTITDLDDGRIRVITINRKKARNAFDDWLYLCIADALHEAEKDENVLIVILTGGDGDFFSSGADLRSTENLRTNEQGGELAHDPTGVFMRTMIRFPKLLIAAVNGPAIGVGCSMLPICDLVYASETSYFQVPFSRIAVCPEMCSSVTFPQLLGTSTANEMLLLGKQLSVQRAAQLGFVSRIFPKQDFFAKVLQEVRTGVAFPLMERTLPLFKNMLRKWDLEFMDKLCVDELREIDVRAARGDIKVAVQSFLVNSKKAKM